MGLFDHFRKPSRPALLDALKSSHELQKKSPPPESSLMQVWWEGRHEGKTLAFMQWQAGTRLFLGEVVEVSSMYLWRAAPGEAFRPGFEPPAAGFPQMQIAGVGGGIARLSPSVRDVQLYENDRGLSLLLGAEATPESVASDLAVASDMLRALEAGGD